MHLHLAWHFSDDLPESRGALTHRRSPAASPGAAWAAWWAQSGQRPAGLRGPHPVAQWPSWGGLGTRWAARPAGWRVAMETGWQPRLGGGGAGGGTGCRLGEGPEGALGAGRASPPPAPAPPPGLCCLGSSFLLVSLPLPPALASLSFPDGDREDQGVGLFSYNSPMGA